MGLFFYDAVAQASLDALVGSINDGAAAGRLEIRDGTRPAVNAALTGTVLAEFTLADPAFSASTADGTAATALASGLPITDAAAAATGTATYGAILDSDNNVKWTGTVTATGGGGDFTIDDVAITAGQPVLLTAYSIAQAQV